MEAVGQARQVAFGIRRDIGQFAADDGFERWRRPLRRPADQQPRHAARPIERLLRPADIHHQKAGGEVRFALERRQRYAVADAQARAILPAEFLQRPGRDQRAARRHHEGGQVGLVGRRQHGGLRRQRHRIDADDAERAAVDLHAAFQQRRDRPSGAAQPDEQVLREGRVRGIDQHRGAGAAEHRRGAVVARACLLVQCLHAAPQRGRRDQADRQCRRLHRMPPPVAQQDGEYPQRAVHASRPACRCIRRSSVAASRCE